MSWVVFVARNVNTKYVRVKQNDLWIFFFFRKMTLIFVASVNPRKRRVRNRSTIITLVVHTGNTVLTLIVSNLK